MSAGASSSVPANLAVTRTRLVVEADGGSRGNPGPAAYGTVVKDADSGAGSHRDCRVSRHGVQQRGGVQRSARRPARSARHRPASSYRSAHGLEARRRADEWPLEDQASRHADHCVAVARCARSDADHLHGVPRSENAHADRLVNEALDLLRAASSGRRSSSVPPSTRPRWSPRPRPSWSVGPPTSPARRLVLLRHGETRFTAEKRFSGSGDDPG